MQQDMIGDILSMLAFIELLAPTNIQNSWCHGILVDIIYSTH